MAKKPFTTRIDELLLRLAQAIGEEERRSPTGVLEIALIEYAERRGYRVDMSTRIFSKTDNH